MGETSVFGGNGDEPTPEEMETWRRRLNPPVNEVPCGTAMCLLLGRTEDVAVAITAVVAYASGFSFDLAVRLRSERAGGFGHRMYGLITGRDAEPPSIDERLLIGLEYADGRTATNINPIPEPAEDEVGLVPTGGGGGGRSFDQGYWVTPLPPPGPLAFVCAWPAVGITETRTTLDAAPIAQAATLAQVLWPWQPEEPQPFLPPDPPAPSSGWFADAVRRRPDPPPG